MHRCNSSAEDCGCTRASLAHQTVLCRLTIGRIAGVASCLEDRVSARFQSASNSCFLSVSFCCLLGPYASLFQELHARRKLDT